MTPRTPHPRRPGQAGYSLVEVSLSVLVLAVGLSSILAVFPTAVSWGGRSTASMTGAYAARSALAELQRMYASIDGAYNISSPGEILLPNQSIGSTGEPGTYYWRAYATEGIPSGSTPQAWKTIIWIYRTDPDNVQFDPQETLGTYYGTFIDYQ